jgi:hypothetical protein
MITMDCPYCRDWKGIKSTVEWNGKMGAVHRLVSCSADYKHHFLLSEKEAEELLEKYG